MNIKLRYLEVFNALFAAGSVSDAARKLNLSQPAVSIALNNLEEEMGFKLFHRARGFFEPTGEAMLLQNEFEQGLIAISRIEQRAIGIQSGATGGVTIATNGALAIHFLPKVIAAFQRDNPEVNVELRVHSSRKIASWVSERQIDIGLIDGPVPVSGLNAQLFYIECVCIMRKDDPLTKLKTIRPEDFEGRSIISITGDHNVDRQLAACLLSANVSVSQTLSSYYFAIARNMVAESGKIAIIDDINGKLELGDNVTWRVFTPKITHQLAMVTSSDQPMRKAAKKLHQRLLERLE